MDIAHLLLGRTWLYDNIVKHYSRNNIYKFIHDKNILLRPAKLASGTRPVDKSCTSNTPTQRL